MNNRLHLTVKKLKEYVYQFFLIILFLNQSKQSTSVYALDWSKIFCSSSVSLGFLRESKSIDASLSLMMLKLEEPVKRRPSDDYMAE